MTIDNAFNIYGSWKLRLLFVKNGAAVFLQDSARLYR
jgi:hypothetical protein